MAKKIITPEMELDAILEKIHVGSSSIYFNMNGILLVRTAIDRVLIVVPDKLLLISLIESNKINIEELTIDHKYYNELHELFKYAEDLDRDDWISIDGPELYNGSVIKIKLNDCEYPIEITKDLLPIKLKKAEYIDVYYKIFIKPTDIIVSIRKDFKSTVDGYSYTTMTLFRVI